jgi:hypothetical protein
MPTQETIDNAAKWFKNNDIECRQEKFFSPKNRSIVTYLWVCVKGHYMQITNDEIEYRAKLCSQEFKTYPYDKAI